MSLARSAIVGVFARRLVPRARPMWPIVRRGLSVSHTQYNGKSNRPVDQKPESAAPKAKDDQALIVTGEAKEAVPEAVAKPEAKMTIWERIKHEAQHYWDGTKLLGYEMQVSMRLAIKAASGYELTRRENRQLRRTTQDIVRLVPFSVLVIVPFAELLIPVMIRIFPNFLPSTYESGKDREAKVKRLRATRSKVSQLLRETVAESGMMVPKFSSPQDKDKFKEFFTLVRSNGERPSRELLVAVAQMFKDDTVLDNLSRPQLVATAKYMNLQPFGTNLMLRYQIRHKLKQIKTDDRAIDYEGVESLSTLELQVACAARGIKTHSVSPGRLRDDLANWLELRLHQKVPSTLLILSSAYNYGQPLEDIESHYDALEAVLSALPEELYHEAELEVSSDQATNKQRLEVIKEQQELIQDENKEEAESGHIIQVKDILTLEEEVEAEKAEAEKAEAEKAEAEKAEAERVEAEKAEAEKAEAEKAEAERAEAEKVAAEAEAEKAAAEKAEAEKEKADSDLTRKVDNGPRPSA